MRPGSYFLAQIPDLKGSDTLLLYPFLAYGT